MTLKSILLAGTIATALVAPAAAQLYPPTWQWQGAMIDHAARSRQAAIANVLATIPPGPCKQQAATGQDAASVLAIMRQCEQQRAVARQQADAARRQAEAEHRQQIELARQQAEAAKFQAETAKRRAEADEAETNRREADAAKARELRRIEAERQQTETDKLQTEATQDRAAASHPDTTSQPELPQTTKVSPKKEKASLDYSKPIYTTQGSFLCPLSAFLDRRQGHGIEAIYDAYTSIFYRQSKAEAAGCQVWHGGIRVDANRSSTIPGFVEVDNIYFSKEFDLTNDPSGERS